MQIILHIGNKFHTLLRKITRNCLNDEFKNCFDLRVVNGFLGTILVFVIDEEVDLVATYVVYKTPFIQIIDY